MGSSSNKNNGYSFGNSSVSNDGVYFSGKGSTPKKSIHAKIQKEKRDAKAKIPEWVKRGEALIYPERLEEWKKCVQVRADDLYEGDDLEAALKLMEMIDSGASFDDVRETFESQDHSGASYGMVRSIVLSFSKKGPEFIEYIADEDMSKESREYIASKKKENMELEQKHKNPEKGSVESMLSILEELENAREEAKRANERVAELEGRVKRDFRSLPKKIQDSLRKIVHFGDKSDHDN